jgi:hypothetical protein
VWLSAVIRSELLWLSVGDTVEAVVAVGDTVEAVVVGR